MRLNPCPLQNFWYGGREKHTRKSKRNFSGGLRATKGSMEYKESVLQSDLGVGVVKEGFPEEVAGTQR